MQSHIVATQEIRGMNELFFSKFSYWTHLKKVVSWMLRFKDWLIMKSKVSRAISRPILKGPLSVEQIKNAENAIISSLQMQWQEGGGRLPLPNNFRLASVMHDS